MLTLSVQFLFMINILVKTISSQYYANPYYQSMPQQYQVQPTYQYADYDAEPIQHKRRSGRHKKYGNSGGRLPVDYEDGGNESEECNCSCGECNTPKPCCKEACFSCPNIQGSPSFVFVPFPYPLVVPNLSNETTTTPTTTTPTTTTSTTTTSTTTTSTTITPLNTNTTPDTYVYNGPGGDSIKINNNLDNDERRYMLTSFRKTKPTWEPRYGIVPIPDTLAEKLMSQLRSVKELQARRNRFK